MRKAEIDALVRAHRGRARPVAFFHVLRQATLEPDDHAFLREHVDELGTSDLLRWRARCEEGFTGPVIQKLARLAVGDPALFQHEVLDVPRLELDDDEWRELADQVRGKVPADLFARIAARGGPRPAREPIGGFFLPGVIDLPGLTLDEESAPVSPPAARAAAFDLDALSTREVLAARRAGQLFLDEQALCVLLMERARAPVQCAEDWSYAVLDFPEGSSEAVLEKARRSARGQERANLLSWLETRGVPRAALLPVALASAQGGQVSYPVLCWMARQLSTRAAWDKYGLTTLSVLMAQRAFPEVSDLVTVSWSEAGRGGEEPPRGLLEAIQVAFALALIGMTREALARGDEGQAMAALSALACLDPPSRVSRAVHELRRAAGASQAVADLVAVNERLVKHSDARDASLEGVVAALHAIADAFG